MTNSDAFRNLEGFNLGICNLSGAGRGIDTPRDATQRYATLIAIDVDKARSLIAAARKAPDASAHRHYIDGIEGALERALTAKVEA